MARKKKLEFETNYLMVRLILTAVILVAFLLTFFLGNGLDFFKVAAAVKDFNKYPFEIHFIDVGLGDSIFMRLPNNKTMLVDCGPNEDGNHVVEYLSDLFTYEKIDALDYLVLTHQDADHVGKGADIFETFQVNAIYRPKVLSKDEVTIYGNPNSYKTSTTQTYNNVIMAAYKEANCEIIYTEKNIKLFDSDFSVEFLSPAKDTYSNSNDYSPMIMVTYLTRKFLLTGDGESVAEKEVIATYGNDLKADVLKVGHHGSNTSTSLEFLEMVKPQIAVISVSENNKYKFPKLETLGRLEVVGAKVLTTSKFGTIAMTVDSNGNIIEVYSSESKHIDVPILIVCCCVALILVWGIKVRKKTDKKN